MKQISLDPHSFFVFDFRKSQTELLFLYCSLVCLKWSLEVLILGLGEKESC